MASTESGAAAAGSPQPAVANVAPRNRDPGLALCLSGGGFRATLFHLGALRRLNELGVLARVKVISSVSGGSILNGIIATRWNELVLTPTGIFANFADTIVPTVRDFCSRDLRTKLLLGARLNPVNLPVLLRGFGAVPANFLADAYQTIMRRQRLADLPAPDAAPRFVFCATSVQTGACWHFHGGKQGRMGDFYTGYCPADEVRVSDAVAASSAFPPGFGALRLPLPARAELTRIDPWGEERVLAAKRKDLPGSSKHVALLTDGGVYDNLGVEPIWNRCRTLLVSDAGRPFESVGIVHQAIVPRLRRAFEISGEQVGAVRKRWLVERFELGRRKAELEAALPQAKGHSALEAMETRNGAYWAINTRREDFQLADAQGYGKQVSSLFAAIRTDLNAFTDGEIACVENHGYSLADAAVRKFARRLCAVPAAPFCWPSSAWAQDACAADACRDSGRRRLLYDLRKALAGMMS